MQRFISEGIRERHSQAVDLFWADHATGAPFYFHLFRLTLSMTLRVGQ